MTRPIAAFLTVILLCSFSVPIKANGPPRRALFVSVIAQDPPVLSSRQAISGLIDFAGQAGIQTLFVQIYQSGRAWFPSKIADPAPYNDCLKSVGEDPMALLIKEAHAKGIQVHAWLNLMSLGVNSKARFIQKYGTDILTRNMKSKKKLEDYKIDGQYFLEPGDPRVKADLTATLEEVLAAYPDLDGVQFDYIRYPDVEPHYGFTKVNIERFKAASGLVVFNDNNKPWNNWKRDQVTAVVQALSQRARLLHPGIQVSTTGCMPYARAYYEAKQDWPSWVARGLTDFVTVMDYSDQPDEFERWIGVAKEKVPDLAKLGVSIGAYKMVGSPQTFEDELKRCESEGVSCAVFHYGSVVDSPGIKTFLTSARP